MLGVCQQVAAIPMKRAAPPETRFLERDEVEPLFRPLPRDGRLALRDRCAAAVPLQHRRPGAGGRRSPGRAPRSGRAPGGPPARQGRQVADLPAVAPDRRAAHRAARLGRPRHPAPAAPCSAPHAASRSPASASTRSCAATPASLDDPRTGRSVSPHVFRHTAAVHLLEAGVEVNVIRGWLGHADLTTTNRYAEINTRTKLAALRAVEPPGTSAGSRATARSGGPTNRSSTGSPRSDRYVAGGAPIEPPIVVKHGHRPSLGHITRPGTEPG